MSPQSNSQGASTSSYVIINDPKDISSDGSPTKSHNSSAPMKGHYKDLTLTEESKSDNVKGSGDGLKDLNINLKPKAFIAKINLDDDSDDD